MSDSTLYTIGTALNRAKDNNVAVQLLVEGEWLSGQVMAVDGHGVVLNCEALEHSVVRMENIAAVRILSEPPMRQSIPIPAQVTTYDPGIASN
jgi:sRNA-binding regulator protein Hfq